MYEADIFMSIGPGCRAIHYLRRNKLTWFAAPLDWQLVYSLDTVLHLYETHFSDFLTDIREIEAKPGAEHRAIYDVGNDMKCLHHFPKDVSLKVGQAYVKNLTKLRYVRSEKALNEAKKIVFLGYWDAKEEDLLRFFETFIQQYPGKEISLYNVRNVPEEPDVRQKEIMISDKLRFVEYSFNDKGTEPGLEWVGNKFYWEQIIKQFRLSPESQKRREEACQKSSKYIEKF